MLRESVKQECQECPPRVSRDRVNWEYGTRVSSESVRQRRQTSVPRGLQESQESVSGKRPAKCQTRVLYKSAKRERSTKERQVRMFYKCLQQCETAKVRAFLLEPKGLVRITYECFIWADIVRHVHFSVCARAILLMLVEAFRTPPERTWIETCRVLNALPLREIPVLFTDLSFIGTSRNSS